MLVEFAFALALAAAPQDAPQPPPQDGAVNLEDVVVVGRPLERMISDFVGEVAAPARNRGLARWRGRVCVGVANLRADAAQVINDEVSRAALDLGLVPGDPGCRPNILVIATADADAFTRDLVERRTRYFRVGGAGMDAGTAAFRRFMDNDRPVRWWNVSMPVNRDSGERAVRIPGVDPCSTPLDCAPITKINGGASHFRTQIVDDLGRVFVILDMDRISGVSAQQLGGYVAMVSLAQIDPDADTRGYGTILNLFDDPDGVQGLTQWDRAYLSGLYESERMERNPSAHRAEIVDEVRRQHARLRAEAATSSD